MADDLNHQKRKKRQKTEKNAKKPRTSSKKKPGFDQEIYKETEYYIKDGLRHVKPYQFTFTTYCKGRWLQRKLIDVLTQEFQSETTKYYRKAIEAGNITVNGVETKEDLILKDNDLISHAVHRHEPPVTAEPIQVIAETEEIVVVNKPSSIPIHPCGRYRHNTLVFLLGREFGLTNLYTIHRIDRLTSGIVMFAKSLEKAQELEKQIREHKLHKEYVCKVRGEFPSGVVDCKEPIAVVSHKVGVCRVHVDGKPCRTVFTCETFDGTNSIVKCQPQTGRMHQIRVHLQWLGYPIVDDPIYNHEAWGPNRGKGGVEEEKAWKVIESIANSLRNNDAGITALNSQPHSQNSPTSNKGVTTSSLEHCDTKAKISERNSCDESKLVSTCETLERSVETKQEQEEVNEMKDDKSPRGRNTTHSSYSNNRQEIEKNLDVEPKCDNHFKTMSDAKSKRSTRSTEQAENEIRSSKVTTYEGRAKVEKNPELEQSDFEEINSILDKEAGLSNVSSEQINYSTSDNKEAGTAGQDESRTTVWNQENVPSCTECQIKRCIPTPTELTMCLHAAVYKGPDWEFRCPWPSWAASKTDKQTTD